MFKHFKQLILTSALSISAPAFSALTIHPAPVVDPPKVENESILPEEQSVWGRGREQRLDKVLAQVTKNQLLIRFVEPNLKDMRISWRAKQEPLQIVLTRLGRLHALDITMDIPSETLYIDRDKGQCDAFREAHLYKTKKMWEQLNISDLPTLPPRLAITTDTSGYAFRLC
ncbi:hypothetical protein TUMSATVNIG1_60110 (plasmid) [Vibrio nigripulchritudo]|uniref:hypothetical protein n=1 Tax=Vibrio nigripulchritudo TaxID=28173 RepID=UPI00190BD964|nr:hypothetical protein [Vibrio nigripulchritudo]BCL74025.1 hypothetical protein VNTUMSATTG_59620 [Vibrio nigripulchritudo]BDU35402.1 hypothetical protein TUMSATVNIG1_60110 [Vibrio nigripulchritudo]